jgi:hypothetical protein
MEGPAVIVTADMMRQDPELAERLNQIKKRTGQKIEAHIPLEQ